MRSVFNADPFEVLAYRGYGNGSRAHVYGRALEKRGIGATTDADSTLRNLLNTYRRADSDPLAHARVVVEHAGKKTSLEADDEGFFGGWIDAEERLEDGDEWHDYEVELLSERAGAAKVRGREKY